MKTRIRNVLKLALLLLIPTFSFAQAPPLGTAADYVIFTTTGAIGNTGISHLTGNVGTNNGGVTGFGNVNGVMTYTSDLKSAQCAADLLIAYNQLNSTIPAFFPAPLLGNGDTLNAGVYSITGATTLNLSLTLNAEGNPNAVFIFQIQGPLSTNANSKIKLINGAKACNVFWKVEGLVSMASGTSMKGTVIANNAAITMSAGDTLEGRVLSTAGAVNVSGVLAYTPSGCGSPVLSGPLAPSLVSAQCYAIFSSSGSVSNVGITNVVGDVGTNSGLTTGYNPLFVTGAIHPIPDGSTTAAASDLLNAYSYLNTLAYDIELLYPVQFGNQLVLTPHTYLLNAATTLTDTVFLDAQGNATAVFVMKIYGALSTSTHSKVKMINGTQSKNVYWLVNGAVSIGDYSEFVGTIICNNGAINLMTGVVLDGRALTTTGALSTSAITAIMPPGCSANAAPVITTEPDNKTACNGDSVSFSVTATGTSLTYQWRKGNINLINGGNISGVTTDILTINPVNISDTASNYNVIVSGSVLPNDTSIDVSLKIDFPFVITQPSNKTACQGDSVSFSVTATGTGLTYQWRKGNTNLINGLNISGATSATLIIEPVSISDSASDYNVIINGTCSPGDTSNNVSLLIDIPKIITNPSDKTACIGDSVSFSITATGTGLTYQWRKGSTDLINVGNISGSTSAMLVINPVTFMDTAFNYNVIVAGTCLPKDTSTNVSLVIDNPIIISEPINQIVGDGDSVSFSVTATGTGLSYQWRKGSMNLNNGGNISGSNTAMLTINPASIMDTASDYNVVIIGSCPPNDTSINVSLQISSFPQITTEPINKTICLGDSVSFSVSATGAGLTYQWRKGNVNLINGGNISGSTTAILTINPVIITDAANNYNVIVSGTYLPDDTSSNVSLVLNTAPLIITEPTNKNVCSGSSVSFKVTATGTGLTYQWKKGNVNLTNGGNISGATSSILTINPVSISDAATNYNVVVSGTCLPNDTSVSASLAINTAVAITTAPVNQIVCEGDSAIFYVDATGTNLTYQWRKGNINLINGGNISGVNSDTLIINPANISDSSSNYNVVITGLCSVINSSHSTVDLKSAGDFGIIAGVGISSTGFSEIHDMNIGISPGVRSSITGFPPAIVVNGSIFASDDVAPPGIAALLVQVKQDLTDAYLFAEGATAPAPATVAGDQGGLTLAPGIYKSTSTLLIQSGDLTLDAQGDANASWIFQIASDFTTVGGAGGNVILSGGAQAKNVIWQVGSSATIGNGTSFKGNILALTSITMNTGSTIDGRLLARNGAVVLSGTNIINSPSGTTTNVSTLTSSNVSLIVNPLPVTSLITGNTTPLCSSVGNAYSVINTLGSTYLWTVPAGAIITSGAGTNSIQVTFGTTNGNIKVVETDSNGCVGIQVIKTINLLGCGLNADFISNITTVCSGSSVIFTDNSTGTSPTTTYSWNFGINATPLTATGIGPHTVTYTGTGSNTVSLTITDGLPTSTKTVLNYITIIPTNTIALTSGAGTNLQTKCINTAITTITYSTTGAAGATFSGLPAGVTGSWLANVVTISGTPSVSGTFNYTVTLTGGCGIANATGTITVTPNNTIALISAVGTNNQTKCLNTAITAITYSTTGATGATFSGLPAGVTGNWLANVVTISGTPSVSGTFNYTITLTGGCGIVNATGTITVILNNTIALTSAVGTNNQNLCINSAIATITYSTTGATGAVFSALPAGLTGSWLANVVTISGTPIASGIYNYTVTLTGGCGIANATGTITVTPNNTITLTSAVGTNNQNLCINSSIATITYSTTGATGAVFSALPAGLTGSWLANVVTISGTPIASGIYNYTVTLTGGCGIVNATGAITVSPNNTIALTSTIGTNNQTLCINSAITAITYSTTGATSATFAGLPAGVTGNWLANVVTISGTPSVSGTFNYTVTLTGGCGIVNATGAITVSPNNTIALTSAIGTNNQTLCINSAITAITYSTTGATSATFAGLPVGITGNWLANVVTISGTPSVSGTFNYTVTLTGGCGIANATGTITVTPNNTITLTSAVGTNNQNLCINSSIATITYSTTGATGAVFSALPAGLTGSWLANVVTISGTPIASGIYNYIVTLTGGCGIANATGTINVTPNNTIALTSVAGTNNQTLCINSAITAITYSTTGATSATFAGLPAGITGNWLANVVTISGTPSVSGTFNYTVTLTGGCGITNATGTITVTPNNTIALTSAVGTNNQTLCINSAITAITYSTTGATSATFAGLPAGVTGNWLANVITISGTPSVSGTFNYTVTLTGGCGTANATGTITVNPITGATSFTLGATTVCQNAINSTYTATAINSTAIVYSVLPATAGIINATTGEMNWNAGFIGSATITATSSGLCGTTTADLLVNVIALPIAIASSNSPVCVNSPINLNAQTVIGGNYLWTGPNSFSTTDQNPVILSAIIADAGNYTLTVTANGCTSVPTTIAVVVNICPADLSVVKTVNIIHPLIGRNVIFTITATNNGPYTATGVIVTDILESGYTYVTSTTNAINAFNPLTGILNVGTLNSGASIIMTITATVNSAGSYANTATISGIEIDLDITNNTSTIETDPTDFFIPEGFSPNGDGINDLFVIRGIQFFPSNSILIFNRWGNKVFESSPYQNTWDGTSKLGLQIGGDDKLPVGTYFYLLNLGDNSDVIKGTIYLNR